MCIVADSVKDVSNTKIASFHVAYSLDDKQTIIPAQLIVYSANVDSTTNSNAFILPVYNPDNNYRKIIPLDFSKFPQFFDKIDNIYNRWFPKPVSYSRSNSTLDCFSNSGNFLEVHTVGDYKFSIMPSKIDFNRIDRSQLNISPIAKISIDAHSNDYSFIVYQFFQKGNIDITPFGYLCEPCKENSMIIPTIHGHPHDSVPTVGLGYVPNMFVSYKSDFEDSAEFDHEIYTLVKNSMSTMVKKEDVVDIDKILRNINMDYMNRKIRVFAPKSFVPNRFTIKGYKPNRNLFVNSDNYNFINDLVI